jgi:peptidoglycan/xylan/chitin deacetylase (PgdA/CDA1 family)
LFVIGGCHRAGAVGGVAAGYETTSNTVFTCDHGGIVRGPTDRKRLALIFTGGQFGEGTETILNALRDRGIKASFFVTGDFLRRPEHQVFLRRMAAEGHYLGPHSDGHLLYCSWEDRNKTLVTRDAFRADLEKNLADLGRYGRTPGQMRFFIPPYEWYNEQIVTWSREMGLVLFNFTPGARSNADYLPDDDPRFIPSRRIYESILEFEAQRPGSLNGFLLLLHLGSGPQRIDKMHSHIAALLDELTRRGYTFVRVDELLAGARASRAQM